MAWSAAVSMTGSVFGRVTRMSKVVTVSLPILSRRETYSPGSRSRWLTVKLAIFSIQKILSFLHYAELIL